MQVYFSMPGGNIEKQEYSMESSQLTQHSSELIGSFCRQTGQNGHVLDRFCRLSSPYSDRATENLKEL